MAFTQKQLDDLLKNAGKGVRVISEDSLRKNSASKPVPKTPKTDVQAAGEVFKGGLLTIFIAGDVRSSKNSQRIGRRGDGSPLVMQSKAAGAYVKATRTQWESNCNEFKRAAEHLPRPLSVVFQWVRKTKGEFDHTGPLEMALDCMTGKKLKNPAAAWITDDTVKDICPIPHPVVIYDKGNAGVYITLLAKHPLV